jgi:pimeloyl-ACP methyl ester carboxylesterase
MNMSANPKRIYALHGLAGSPNDWNILEQELKGSAYKIIKADSYNPKVLRQIEDEETNVFVITHSWGAYVLIKSMSKLKITDKIEKVILVNPYVEVENPLRPLIAFLLRVPLLGEQLIKLSHKKGAVQFFQKMIAPYKYTDIPYFTEVEIHLKSLEEWRKTVLAKIKHQREPLGLNLRFDLPVDVLIGFKDKAATSDFQLEFIKKIFKNLVVHEFVNEGHGILWTQAKKITEILQCEKMQSTTVREKTLKTM